MKRVFLISMLILTAAVMSGAERKTESISFKSSKKTVLNVSVDGQPVKVKHHSPLTENITHV